MIEEHDLKRAVCPNCVAEMRVNVIKEHLTSWEEDDHPVSGSDRYWILECRGCDAVFFGHGSSFSENIDHYYDAAGNWRQSVVEETKFYPRTIKRRKPVWFDWRFKLNHSQVASLLNELYQALDNEMPVLSAAGSRIVFDAVSEHLQIDSNLSFSEKIEQLRKDQHITGREKDFLKLLTDSGGAAAHRGWSPSDEEINTILEILEGFIHRAMVLPTKVQDVKLGIPNKNQK